MVKSFIRFYPVILYNNACDLLGVAYESLMS